MKTNERITRKGRAGFGGVMAILLGASVAGVMAQEQLVMPAKLMWANWGVNLLGGQDYAISASGSWTTGAWTGGAEGDTNCSAAGSYLLLGTNCYSLIGKIDTNAPFFIGTGTSGTAPSPGVVSLSMNDVPGIFWDNSGSLDVTINPIPKTNSVAANVMWVDSGLTVSAGQALRIRASGTWTSGSWTGGPDGHPDIGSGGYISHTAHCYSLIAKVGSGTPFQVGGQFDGIVSDAGTLYFSMNDVPGEFGDNSGSLSVVVSTVSPKLLDIKLLVALYLTGPIGSEYRIEYTPVLGPTNWTTLTNITLPTQPYIYVDYDTPTAPQRFYRAVPVP
jgi:hypothetical protein